MDFYIYVMRNISSNKIYVGKSHDPQTRRRIQLANEYNVSKEQINRIIRNVDWKHLRAENE
tara:strand:- start:5001 stop:5183 length:183 start_codon:yes stop_codon:yes gene_type:complete